MATSSVVLACALVFGVVSVRSYEEPHTFLFGDCPYYAATAVSLIADGDLKIENNIQGGAEIHAGQVSVGADGEWRPKHPVLMPIVSIPFLKLLGVKGLLVFNVVVLVVLAAVTHRLSIRGASPVPAAVATVITCLLTFIVTYSYNYSPDAFAAIPALLAVIFLLDRRPLASGLAAGITVLAKPVHVLLVAVCGIFVLARGGWRAALRFAGGLAPPVTALLLYNQLLFGGPLTFSYDRMLAAETATATQRSDFSLSLIPGNLAGQFLDVEHGLVYTAPSALIAAAGLLFLWRRRPLLALLPAVLAMAYVGFFSTYAPWMTSHYGNRFLFVVVLASALPLAALLERAKSPGPGPEGVDPAPAEARVW